MYAKGYGNLCFGSLDEVIKVGDFVCLDEGKECSYKVSKVARVVEHEELDRATK